MKAHTN